jgi:hypothetical protein
VIRILFLCLILSFLAAPAFAGGPDDDDPPMTPGERAQMERDLRGLGQEIVVESDGGERNARLWGEIVLQHELGQLFQKAVPEWCSTPTSPILTLPDGAKIPFPWARPGEDGKAALARVFTSLIPWQTSVVSGATESHGAAQILTITPTIVYNTWRRFATWAANEAAESLSAAEKTCWLGVAAGASAISETGTFFVKTGKVILRATPELAATVAKAIAAGLL